MIIKFLLSYLSGDSGRGRAQGIPCPERRRRRAQPIKFCLTTALPADTQHNLSGEKLHHHIPAPHRHAPELCQKVVTCRRHCSIFIFYCYMFYIFLVLWFSMYIKLSWYHFCKMKFLVQKTYGRTELRPDLQQYFIDKWNM